MAAQEAIKGKNLKSILLLLRRRPGLSRADLARLTGLQRSTVSNLVRELLEDSRVIETGRGSPGSSGGKPTILLALNPGRGYYVSLLWGSRGFEAALVDASGAAVYMSPRRVPPAGDPEAGLLRLLHALPADAPSGAVLGVALVAGSVVTSAGAIRASAGFPHSLPDAPGLLRQLITAVPGGSGVAPSAAVVENDANCVAIHAGECARDGIRHLLALVFTARPPSVGAGLLADGTIWRGSHGSAGELLPPGRRHTLRELDRAAATALRFADPDHLAVTLPDSIGWEDLTATAEVVRESGITMEQFPHRDAALLGAANLAFQAELEVYVSGGRVQVW